MKNVDKHLNPNIVPVFIFIPNINVLMSVFMNVYQHMKCLLGYLAHSAEVLECLKFLPLNLVPWTSVDECKHAQR